jgi:hypothetical protein
MVEIQCISILQGKNLTPGKLEVPYKLRLISTTTPGDIVKQGKDKGKPAKEGCCVTMGTIDDTLEFIESVYNEMLKDQTLINITINVNYRDQCNFEIQPHHLTRFAALNIPLGISCYSE